jgi:hypothetical protein
MCRYCNGLTKEQNFAWYREKINTTGWAVISVEADEEAAFAYTLGLTRFHGHPEILIAGLPGTMAGYVLNDLGREVGLGHRFEHGQLAHSDDGRTLQFVQIEDPSLLTEAQALYSTRQTGLIPALQVVYTDEDGRWPWDNPCPNCAWYEQPVFGVPQFE